MADLEVEGLRELAELLETHDAPALHDMLIMQCVAKKDGFIVRELIDFVEATQKLNESSADKLFASDLAKVLTFPPFESHPPPADYASWSDYLKTRGFALYDNNRARRLLSHLLTYPATIASVLGDAAAAAGSRLMR